MKEFYLRISPKFPMQNVQTHQTRWVGNMTSRLRLEMNSEVLIRGHMRFLHNHYSFLINRSIMAVRIQIQSIAPIGILLSKSGNDRIVKVGMEIVLPGSWVWLLTDKLEAVGILLLTNELSQISVLPISYRRPSAL